MAELRMPSLGADMEAGTLVVWRCAVGDRVARGDVVAEVDTDKGVLEVEAYAGGVVEALLVEPGAKVPVGTPLATLREGEEPAAAPPEAAQAPEDAARAVKTAEIPRATETAPHATPSARQAARERGVDLGAIHGTGRHGTITAADVAAATSPAVAAPAVAPPTGAPPVGAPLAVAPPVGAAPAGGQALAQERARQRVSPLARARAEALGVQLEGLAGSGPEGSVVLADVERSHASAVASAQRPGSTAPAPSAAAAAADPKARMRQAIAASMARSKREIPHYYVSHTIDLEPALTWLERENVGRGVEARLLPAVLTLHAVVKAVQRFPELNGHFAEGAARPSAEVHLGVAIALRGGGLVAPAILSAQSLGLDELMARLEDLVARARTGKLRASEMGSATITVTSLGDRGVDAVFPVIVPPQVAMVGFGTIVRRPFVVGDEVRPRRVVTASLAADHRVSDGHRGGLFLAAVAAALEEVGRS